MRCEYRTHSNVELLMLVKFDAGMVWLQERCGFMDPNIMTTPELILYEESRKLDTLDTFLFAASLSQDVKVVGKEECFATVRWLSEAS